MKKMLPFMLLLLFSTASISQVIETPPTVQTDYLKKSKDRQNAAWLFLAGGGLLLTTGLALYPEDYDWLFGTTPEKEGRANLASAMVLLGTVSVGVSIPFFISATANKNKARKEAGLGFKMERVPVPQQQSIVSSSYPALTLKLSL